MAVQKKPDKQVQDKKEPEVEVPVDPTAAVRDDIKTAALLILQAVSTKEYGQFVRILRLISTIRKKQTPAVLAATIAKFHPALSSALDAYKDAIAEEEKEIAKIKAEAEVIVAAAKAKKLEEEKKREKDNEDEMKDLSAAEKKKKLEAKAKEAKEKADKEAKEAEKKKQKLLQEAKKEEEAANLVETKAFVHLLVCLFLIDKDHKEQAAESSKALVDYIQSFNRRSLDYLSSRAYFYYTLTHERLDQLEAIRSQLLHAHRTACLQHNEPGQAALVVSILRSYLAYKLYNQADKFRLNTNFPEHRSGQLYVRYLYYIGLINAIQLQYSDAYSNLLQAVRKAPQNGALGFRQTAHKLLVIVQLLMGDIPERSVFVTSGLEASLKPYLELTQAVRVGDVVTFEKVVEEHKAVWARDNIMSLITRLRNNVIKAGLRKINLSYSRISLKDIAAKLKLESVEDAEFIVSKCIHDGVIDAVINHEQSFMFSKENVDQYSTHDPQGVFHKRVMFCMDIHNGAVKALRFPKDSHKMADDPDNMRDDDEIEIEIDSIDDD